MIFIEKKNDEPIGFNRLNEHIVFPSKQEMNYAVADHLKSNAAFLRDNSKNILNYLAKIASHHNGACGVLYDTIAERLSITKRTVERCMSELKQHNIIEVVKQYSKRGGRMSSVIRILPFVTEKKVPVGYPVGNESGSKHPGNADGSKSESESEKNTNLSNHHLSSFKQGTEVANLLYIFDDFRNKGLSRPKFEEIVEEAIPIAINLKAYVRKTCENYVKNKQSIAGTLKNKALAIFQRIQKLGSSFNNNSQNTTSNEIIVSTMPSDYYGKIEDAPY
ncbi:hypothetical protein [Brochothrix thermosphacta]|uniref:hypothetical protein n=1 Tax=Brochothrix thermosphacta TaxID=2756 RepID=UPI00083F8C37|nr:hypothetical protein [Brochothrix thermosphacta]ODJ63704.1 hypothetical protein BFR36_11390 [Brochothrix thermosphacta]